MPEPNRSASPPAEAGVPGAVSWDGRGVPRRPGMDTVIRAGLTAITVLLAVVGAAVAVSGGTSAVWAVGAALVFLGWFAAGLAWSHRTADRRVAAWWLIALTAVWLGTVVVSAEFVWLAFPLWLLAGFLLRMRWGLALSVLVFGVVVAAPLVRTGVTSYANVIGPLVGGAFALGISRGYLELIHDRAERRRLVASLITAQRETTALQDELARTQRESGASAERTRLSRDIHDTVAQSMSSIVMLTRAAREDPQSGGCTRALEQIEVLARDGLSDTRRIVNALMPSDLDGSSALRGALGRLLAQLADQAGIATTLHTDDTVPALGIDVEVALLRTAQSALANVRAHADARRVVITLADAGDAVRLDIVDDGRGFDADGWEATIVPGTEGGYGLRSMRERLRELGGGLEVESTPGDGTALSAFIPLAQPAAGPRRAGSAT